MTITHPQLPDVQQALGRAVSGLARRAATILIGISRSLAVYGATTESVVARLVTVLVSSPEITVQVYEGRPSAFTCALCI